MNEVPEPRDVNEILAKSGGVATIVATLTVTITNAIGAPPGWAGWVGLFLCSCGVISMGGLPYNAKDVARFILAVVALWGTALGATTVGVFGEASLRAKPAQAIEVVAWLHRNADVFGQPQQEPTPQPIIQPWLPRP